MMKPLVTTHTGWMALGVVGGDGSHRFFSGSEKIVNV